MGLPAKVIVFSRDEAKQHFMRVEYQSGSAPTDEIIYHNFEQAARIPHRRCARFPQRCGGPARCRRRRECRGAQAGADLRVLSRTRPCGPTSTGPENIIRAIQEHRLPIETVVGVSTDKACKPVNMMGMTKAIQERIFIQANMRCPGTRFVCVRYGNVLASRGSVIPLFHDQIRRGGPVTITTRRDDALPAQPRRRGRHDLRRRNHGRMPVRPTSRGRRRRESSTSPPR